MVRCAAVPNITMLVNSTSFFLFCLSFFRSTSACYWDPKVALQKMGGLYLMCAINGQDYNAFTPDSTGGIVLSCMKSLLQRLLHDLHTKTIAPCDCPCGDLVDVQPPKVSMMALSYLAQAIVVTIVGINLGFRCVRP